MFVAVVNLRGDVKERVLDLLQGFEGTDQQHRFSAHRDVNPDDAGVGFLDTASASYKGEPVELVPESGDFLEARRHKWSRLETRPLIPVEQRKAAGRAHVRYSLELRSPSIMRNCVKVVKRNGPRLGLHAR